jgi:hypothetical protein
MALKKSSSSAGFEPTILGSNAKHDNHYTNNGVEMIGYMRTSYLIQREIENINTVQKSYVIKFVTEKVFPRSNIRLKLTVRITFFRLGSIKLVVSVTDSDLTYAYLCSNADAIVEQLLD